MGQIVFQATLGGQTALVGQNTASSYSLNLPLASDTLVGKATTDTLTNKTIAFASNTFSGSLSVSNGGTGLSSLTAGYIPYGNGTSAFNSNSLFTFDGNNLLVGTTSVLTSGKFNVLSSGISASFQSGNGTTAIQVSNTSGTSLYNAMLFYNNTPFGTVIGSIGCSGSATTFNTSSDYRLKENIQPMQNALATVAQLKPVTYKWKIDGSNGQGFIAHELQAIVPDCVTGEKDAVDENGKILPQGIDTSYLVATLTKAIQEQQALIESLTTRLIALESK